MDQLPPMDMYLSESRINADEEEVIDQENIKPGGKSICHASVQLVLQQHGTIKMYPHIQSELFELDILPDPRLYGINAQRLRDLARNLCSKCGSSFEANYENYMLHRQSEARFLWICLHRSRQSFKPHQTIKPLQTTEH